MFLKNETRWPEPEKNIRIATGKHLLGPYSAASEQVTGNWVEGPTVTQTNQRWMVCFDRYRGHQMGAILSTDMENWGDISDQISFPERTRHGPVLKITLRELERLKAN
jgi:hypothetical protein